MALQPGHETDLAVALACGIKVQRIEGKILRCEPIFSGWLWPEFRPSTDMNDAFLAAEKFGLFDRCNSILGKGGSEFQCWHIARWMPEGSDRNPKPDFYHLVEGATPALAICAAILKLKEEQP